MSDQGWFRPLATDRDGRGATRAQIIETIDRTAPETKSELADAVGISKQYLSELLQDLKGEGIVRKGYLVDDRALYANADQVSNLCGDEDASDESTAWDTHRSGSSTALLELFERLDAITATQYEAARSAFRGESAEEDATTLESLANERHSAVISELKSTTLTTDWPGNRIAADLATIATNLEMVGDRSGFIESVVQTEPVGEAGVVTDRLAEIFAAGARVHEYFVRILFDCELDVHGDLRDTEETIHRDLNELFELVTTYDPETYGALVTVTRALERAIYYWADAADLAVQIHAGVQPEHIRI